MIILVAPSLGFMLKTSVNVLHMFPRVWKHAFVLGVCLGVVIRYVPGCALEKNCFPIHTFYSNICESLLLSFSVNYYRQSFNFSYSVGCT